MASNLLKHSGSLGCNFSRPPLDYRKRFGYPPLANTNLAIILDQGRGFLSTMTTNKLSHLDASGEAHMVDVGGKTPTERSATACAFVSMSQATFDLIQNGGHSKGDVFAVARIAGIQAAKRTAELIPLCHPLMLTSIAVELLALPNEQQVKIVATCKLSGKTGVEMEALTAASVAALTLYDMCKAVDKGMVIKEVKLIEKTGGKSGDWAAEV